MTKNLVFFNKKGNPLNFNYDEENDKWTGNLHFDEVSIGLFESDTIYLLEKLKEDGTGDIIYGHPRISPLTDIDPKVTAKLTTEEHDSFKLFTVDNPYLQNPIIKISKDPIKLQFIKDPTDTYDAGDDITVTSANVPAALRIDVAINSMTSGAFIDVITLTDELGTIIEIELYGEIVGEDERLPILLSNMGEAIRAADEFIFRSSDINEDSPNYKLLNEKRKEFLIELHNIKPYLSAYRGIVNIIKFFGYFDLTLKEYWYDPHTKDYNFEDVRLYETEKMDDPNNNMHKYQKTSLFGLFYDINSVVPGEFDDLGLPVVADNFAYSNEEVLIKLFGLRNYMKRNDIGGVAEIIDIVGEITFFNKFSFNFWIDESQEIVVDQHIQPIFDADVTDSYIRDVRDITMDFSHCPLDRHMDKTDRMYHPCFVGYFAPYFMDDPEYLDQPGIDVGMPVQLTNRTFDLTWSDFGLTWNDTLQSEMLPTWKTVSHMNHYEVEWIVEKVKTSTDKRIWKWSERGTVPDMRVIDLILPYNGIYTVTIIIYGWGNINSKYTKKEYLTAELKNPDLSVFFRYIDTDLQRWKDNPLTWSAINSEWINPIYDNNEFLMSEGEIDIRTFHVANYEFVDALGIPDATIESPTWNELANVKWKDYAYVRWNDLVPDRERLAQFFINKILPGSQIQVGRDVYSIPLDMNIGEYERLALAMSSEIGEDISNFQYNPRIRKGRKYIDAVSLDDGDIGNRYIGACGGVGIQGENRFSTWTEAKTVKWGELPIYWRNADTIVYADAHQNPFTLDNTKSYRTRFDIPVMIPLYMNIDNSQMAGKSQVYWTIIDESRHYTILEDIESLYFVYTFRQEGIYSLKAEIIDTNGNRDTIIKYGMVRVYKTDRFRLLRKLSRA